jgi:hypothetical protein
VAQTHFRDKQLRPDGTLRDDFNLLRGDSWAKDYADNVDVGIRQKTATVPSATPMLR